MGWAAGKWAGVDWQAAETGEDLQVGWEVEGLEGVDWRAEGCTPNHLSDTEVSHCMSLCHLLDLTRPLEC